MTIRNLSKKFGSFVAVEDLSMDVEDGKFVALLGPSGCGKTTTLRMVAGLETSDSGEIYFGNDLMNDIPTEKRDVAMVFQFYAIYPDMSVYDNIAFPLKMQNLPRDEIAKRVKEAAESVRISDILGAKEGALTVGEKQRVAIARAIVRNPKVYLFDEPLTNLDARLRTAMRTEIKKLHRSLGQTSVYVTHDQLEAMTMADKVAVMNNGKLLQYDVPETLFDKPKNTFVAGFIGTPPMNLLDCSLVEKSGKTLLDFGDFTLDITDLQKDGGLRDGSLVAGFRPSDVKIGREGRDGGTSFQAEVSASEDLGDKKLLELKVGASSINTIQPYDSALNPGEKVQVQVALSKLHLFSRKTKEAIL
ncbi:MAG: ABC transporter ATP-binding protein [Thaumarchaeota archaeon]|nr:ABC transporter ATP-binding protein [Nitrososphaerota archaeon]